MLLNCIISIIIAVSNSAVCLTVIPKTLITLPKKLQNPYLSPNEKRKIYESESLKNELCSIVNIVLTCILLYFFPLEKIAFQTATNIILGIALPLLVPLWFYYQHLRNEYEILILRSGFKGTEGAFAVTTVGYTIYMIVLFCMHYFA